MSMALNIAKYPLAAVVAALASGMAAAVITSASNLIWLAGMPVDLNLGVALSVILKDMFRMGAMLMLLLLPAYALAFSAAGALRRWVPLDARLWYGLAAAAGMLAMLVFLVEGTLQIELIAGNRTLTGTLFHLIVAFMGGALFSRLIGAERGSSFVIRALALPPLLFAAWQSVIWGIDPMAASASMGLDLTEVNSAGRNLVMRDMAAFFWVAATCLAAGMYEMRHRWFWVAALPYFYAAIFNFFATTVRGAAGDALVAEIILTLWIAALGYAAYRREKKP